MMVTSDDELTARQSVLQAEATALLDELDLTGRLGGTGQLLLAGSYVSGLMCWRDLDLMLHVGPRYSPHDVLRLLGSLMQIPGVVAFEYHDERGPRSPTGETRDERYHLPITLERDRGPWRVDLTLWLNDPHHNVTRWHESLRDTITTEQRRAVLRIKDVWHRLPTYPDDVSGVDIYRAVLEHGVRTPDQFRAWLAAERGTAAGVV